jgi:hypothetical protein
MCYSVECLAFSVTRGSSPEEPPIPFSANLVGAVDNFLSKIFIAELVNRLSQRLVIVDNVQANVDFAPERPNVITFHECPSDLLPASPKLLLRRHRATISLMLLRTTPITRIKLRFNAQHHAPP